MLVCVSVPACMPVSVCVCVCVCVCVSCLKASQHVCHAQVLVLKVSTHYPIPAPHRTNIPNFGKWMSLYTCTYVHKFVWGVMDCCNKGQGRCMHVDSVSLFKAYEPASLKISLNWSKKQAWWSGQGLHHNCGKGGRGGASLAHVTVTCGHLDHMMTACYQSHHATGGWGCCHLCDRLTAGPSRYQSW